MALVGLAFETSRWARKPLKTLSTGNCDHCLLLLKGLFRRENNAASLQAGVHVRCDR